MAGEVNGLLLCYKSAPLPANPNPLSNLVLPTPSSINQNRTSPLPSYTSSGPTSPAPYTKNSSVNNPIKSPVRPAPLPPKTKEKPSDDNLAGSNRIIVISSATLSGFTGKKKQLIKSFVIVIIISLAHFMQYIKQNLFI